MIDCHHFIHIYKPHLICFDYQNCSLHKQDRVWSAKIFQLEPIIVLTNIENKCDDVLRTYIYVYIQTCPKSRTRISNL